MLSGVKADLPVVRTPVPRQLWEELYDADEVAMPTQSPQWIGCLTATGRYRDASRCYELPDGRRAVLPLVRGKLPGLAATLHSMPNSWGYGGLVAPTGVDETLVSAVLDDLSTTSTLRVHITPNAMHASSWSAATAGRRGVTEVPCRGHILDIGGGFARVWQDRFNSATRTAVRRAEAAGVHVETDCGVRLVPVFYDLLLHSFDRWAGQQHEPLWLGRLRGKVRDPIGKLATIASGMGRDCQVSVAWYRGEPAAAIVVLRGGGNAHYTRGAMNEALAGPVKANVLLHKTVIEAACQDGCRFYYMGESGTSRGLAQFKERFGARPHPFHGYWIERLPVYRADQALRRGVKSVIGFRDA